MALYFREMAPWNHDIGMTEPSFGFNIAPARDKRLAIAKLPELHSFLFATEYRDP
jgi:hypothetical protein